MNKNQKIYTRLCDVIPGGVNSPVRAFNNILPYPLIAASGKKGLIVDAEGKEYIDLCGSWGALIHGHAHPTISEAVKTQLEKGSTFGLSTEVEERLARKVVETVDSIEQVRFVSSGTEATMSAIRLARGFTGKSLVIKFDGNYHGHADPFLVKAGSGVAELSSASSTGIPRNLIADTLSLPYNDSETLKKIFPKVREQLAAVILEPISGNMGLIPAKQEFLQLLREETKKADALLIFDEVITGYRVGLKGAQGLYGITPDLTCLGKILGGGFPMAAFGGRKEIMQQLAPVGPVYQAGTLSGNPVAMVAGYEALKLLEEQDYNELERKTRIITDPLKTIIQDGCLNQVGSMFTLFFGVKAVSRWEDVEKVDQDRFRQFFRYLLDHGIFIPPSPFETSFVSTAHQEHELEKVRDTMLAFFETRV